MLLDERNSQIFISVRNSYDMESIINQKQKFITTKEDKLKMDNFKRLSMQELYDVEGGIFGVDDAIFWTLVAAGFAGGIATGVSRKNRKEQCYE